MLFELSIYLFLSVLSASLGVFYFLYPKNISILFLLFGMIMPTSNQFMDFISFNGIYFYDYFFLALILYYILRFLIKKQISSINIVYIILLLFFFVFYSTFAITSSITFDKYLLRDLRPFLTLIYGIVFISLIDSSKISFKTILNLLIFTFCIKLLFFILIIFGFSFSDIYYSENNLRYFDASTFIAALFLIVSIFKKNSFKLKASNFSINFSIVLAILIVLISNLRILLIALLLIYLFMNHKSLFKKVLIGLVSIFLFLGYSYLMQFERVTNAFFSNELLLQLANRFSPAFKKIATMDLYQYIYGLGFGTYFEIPWFEYRGLDTKLNTIDSTYLTFFVKYGICSIVIFFIFFRILMQNINDRVLKKSILLFYLILFFTMSILYQSGTIMQIIFLNMLMISINNEDTSHTISVNS